MAEGTNTQFDWIPVEEDASTNTKKHAYYVGKFVRIEDIPTNLVNNWTPGLQNSSDYSCYNISDEDKNALKEIHAKYAHFPITHLVHDTKKPVSILIDEKMRKGRAKKYKISEKEQNYHFSWWGLAFDENQIEKYRKPMTEAINSKLRENDKIKGQQKAELLSSHPFSWKPKEQYGPWRFSVPVDDLLKCYEDSLKESCQKRILCTEVYAYEVMHTILVHPATMEEEFKDLQTLEDYMEEQKKFNPVVSRDPKHPDDVNKWLWHPQSTSVRHPDFEFTKSKNPKELKCKCWDHLTFAFLIPEEKDISKTGDIPRREDMVERDNVPGKEDSTATCDTSPRGGSAVSPSGASISLRQDATVTTAMVTSCDGIQIPFKLLMDNLHFLKVQWRTDEEKEKFKEAVLDEVSKLDQMSSDRLENFIVRFWDFIQGNLSEGSLLLVIQHQCEYIEKLIRIVPKELPEHKKELRLAIDKIWNIFKTTTTREQLEEKGHEKGWRYGEYAYNDSKDALLEIVKRVSRIIVETLPPEEILEYDLSYNRSLRVRDMDLYRRELENMGVHEQLWRKIEDILSEGNYLCVIRNIAFEKQEEVDEKYKEALQTAFTEMLHIVETKQTEQFVADGGEGDKGHPFQECIHALKQYPELEKLKLQDQYENIKQAVQGRILPCKANFYQKFKAVVAKCWEKILVNHPEEKLSVVIDAQCDCIKNFMRLIHVNLDGFFPEELMDHEKELPAAINKIWHIIETKLTEIKSEVDDTTIEDGICSLKRAVDRISEFVFENITKLPVEELMGYCQNIQRYELVVRGIRPDDITGDDEIATCKSDFWKGCDELFNKFFNEILRRMCLLEDGKTSLFHVIENVFREYFPGESVNIHQSPQTTEYEQARDIDHLYQFSKEILFQFWDIIVGNLSEEKDLLVVRNQFNHIGNLMGLLRTDGEKLQESVDKALAEKLKLEDKQTNEHQKSHQVVEDGIKDLGDVFRCVSELTMKWFPEEFPVHCHGILQSRQSAISEQSSERYKSHLVKVSKDIWKKLLETIPLLAERHKDTHQPNLKKKSEKEIKDQKDKIRISLLKFWDILEINISVGNLSEMRDQCNNIKELIELIREKFGKILPEELPKHEEKLLRVAIVKVFEVIKTKLLKEKIIEEGRQTDRNKDDYEPFEDGITNLFTVIEDVLDITKNLPPSEFLGYCQIIKQSIQVSKGVLPQGNDFMMPHQHYLYLIAKKVFVKFWDIIQERLFEANYCSVPVQCVHIEKLIEIIRKNFGKVPEEEENLKGTIKDIWKVIEKVQTEEKLTEPFMKSPSYALHDGVLRLQSVVERILQLILNTLPPEDLLNYTEYIQQSVEMVSHLDSAYIVNVKRNFFRYTNDAIQKVWGKLPNNLTQASNMFALKHECEIIQKFIELIKFISQFESKVCVDEYKLQETMKKVREILKTKVCKENIVAEGRQTNKDKNDADALADGIDALGECFSELRNINLSYASCESYPEFSEFLWDIFKDTEDLEKKLDIIDIYLAGLKRQSSENKDISEKSVAEEKRLSTSKNEPLEDGMKVLRLAVGHVMGIPRKALPLEGLLGYLQNIQQSRQAVRSCPETDNHFRSGFDEIANDVLDRLLNTVQDRDREANSEIWKTIESIQAEFVAASKQEENVDDIDIICASVQRVL